MSTINVYNNQNATVYDYEGSTATGSGVDARNPPVANDEGRFIKPPVLPAHREQDERLDALQNGVNGLQSGLNNLQGSVNALQIGQNGVHAGIGNLSAGQSRIEQDLRANTALAVASATANTAQFRELNNKVDELKASCGSLHSTQADTKTPPPKPIVN